MGVKYQLSVTFFVYRQINRFIVEYLFTIQGTAQTTVPMLTLDGSNDVFCRKEVPFGGHNRQKSHFGGILPPKPPNFLP